ncbi:TNNI protein, partial [Acromyrmex charruanus]
MQEKKRKQAETERKRAEVRARLEEASKAKKAKKGFMTPDRKKKLRLLLRKKAAEELKKEQERKAAERRRIIEERCGKPKIVDEANEAELQTICSAYWNRLSLLEGDKYDLERQIKLKELEDNPGRANGRRSKFRRCSAETAHIPRDTSSRANDRAISIFTERDFRVQGGITPGLTCVEPRGKHLEFPRCDATSRAIKHSSIAQLLLPRTWSERGIANLLESEISESFACCEIKSSLIEIPASFVVYH